MIHLRTKAAEICSVLEDFGFAGAYVEKTDLLEDFDGDVAAYEKRLRDYAAFVAHPRRYPISALTEAALVRLVRSEVGEGIEVNRYPGCGEFELIRK